MNLGSVAELAKALVEIGILLNEEIQKIMDLLPNCNDFERERMETLIAMVFQAAESLVTVSNVLVELASMELKGLKGESHEG